jgi:hypothetical protein
MNTFIYYLLLLTLQLWSPLLYFIYILYSSYSSRQGKAFLLNLSLLLFLISAITKILYKLTFLNIFRDSFLNILSEIFILINYILIVIRFIYHFIKKIIILNFKRWLFIYTIDWEILQTCDHRTLLRYNQTIFYLISLIFFLLLIKIIWGNRCFETPLTIFTHSGV